MAEGRVLTYQDLLAFPDDGKRRELLDGELIVSPSPFVRHQRLVGYLYLRIATHLELGSVGEVFFAPMDVLLSDSNVVEPDLFIVLARQSDIVTRENIKGVPELVIEVLSNPRIDRVRKRDIYARFGVPQYWIVDPDADRVEVYRLDGPRYGKPEILEAGDALAFEPLAGLLIDVAELFDR